MSFFEATNQFANNGANGLPMQRRLFVYRLFLFKEKNFESRDLKFS